MFYMMACIKYSIMQEKSSDAETWSGTSAPPHPVRANCSGIQLTTCTPLVRTGWGSSVCMWEKRLLEYFEETEVHRLFEVGDTAVNPEEPLHTG